VRVAGVTRQLVQQRTKALPLLLGLNELEFFVGLDTYLLPDMRRVYRLLGVQYTRFFEAIIIRGVPSDYISACLSRYFFLDSRYDFVDASCMRKTR